MDQYNLDFDSDVQERGLFIESKSDDTYTFLIEEMCQLVITKI